MGRKLQCAVVTCPNHTVANVDKNAIKLHKFPTDNTLRKKWCLLLGVKYDSLNPNFPHRHLVCHEHFDMKTFHSRTCQLLNSYESTASQNTCSRLCSSIPKGMLPTRNLPSSIVSDLAADTSDSAADLKQLLIDKLSLASTSNGTQNLILPSNDAVLPSSSSVVQPAAVTKTMPRILKPGTSTPASTRTRSATLAAARSSPTVSVKIEPTTLESYPVEVFDAQRHQPMQVFVSGAPQVNIGNSQATVAKPNIVCKKPPNPSPAPQQPIANTKILLNPKLILPKMRGTLAVQARPTVVPLPGNLLADMMDGMNSDPDAQIELVWSENPFLAPLLTDVNTMCRMCAKSNLLLTKIVDQDCDLAKMVNECLPFQVNKNDGFSQMICLPCRRSVIRTHKFYVQCRTANALQRNINAQNNLSRAALRTVDPIPKPTLPVKIVSSTAEVRPAPPVLVKAKEIVLQRDIPKAAAPSTIIAAPKRTSETPRVVTDKRAKQEKYPKIKPETPLYSIYKFPDPLNLMQAPDYDCKRCPTSYCSVMSLIRHYWTTHQQHYCKECNSVFDTRKDFEGHHIEIHFKVPPIYNFHYEELGSKTCSFCGIDLGSVPELRRHYVVEGSCPALMEELILRERKFKYKFTCSFCGMMLKSRHTLTRHILTHVNVSDYRCKECDKIFTRKDRLKEHMYTHSTEHNEQCDVCGATFKSRTGLSQHKVVHEGRWNNRCTCCSQTFRFVKDAEAHFKTHSNAEKSKVNYNPFTKVHELECPFCQRPFKWEYYYKLHLKTHDPNSKHFKSGFLCDQCGLNFSNRPALRMHVSKVHGTPIIYECNLCGRKYESKQGLKLHMEKHMGEMKQCKECKQTFNGMTSLRAHQRSVHIDKNFECNYCSKTFKLKRQLVTHIRVHTDERPFQCRHCPSAFKQWGDRRKHEALHLDGK
ncbi:zinc finger protein 423-like [Cloeon dipterum]|uniref:zinc finger protein 423-like n=1 Tax=Cloeon dipterum TaxID=197152 RepID=UPI00321FD9E9